MSESTTNTPFGDWAAKNNIFNPPPLTISQKIAIMELACYTTNDFKFSHILSNYNKMVKVIIGESDKNPTAPRYDEVYYKGLEWLDNL